MAQTVAEISALLSACDAQEFSELEACLSTDDRKGVQTALNRARRRLEALQKEAERLESMYAYQSHFSPTAALVGLDEVGRGPLAGPLTVAGVVLPEEPRIAGLNDSKQIKPEERMRIAHDIKTQARAWAIEHIEADEIDAVGMTACLRMAFLRVLRTLDAKLPDLSCILLDGNALRLDSRERNVIKGDARCASIAAASIIAKVERDALMTDYALSYPEYHFDSNKGYGSAEHIAAIEKYGLSPLHRRSFCRAWVQQELF